MADHDRVRAHHHLPRRFDPPRGPRPHLPAPGL